MKNHLKKYAAVYIIASIGIGGIVAGMVYLFCYVLPNLN